MIPEPVIITPDAWAASECGDTVAVDFETFYTATYSVAELGLWAYVHDPRFHAYLVAVTDGKRTCVCAPAKFPWAHHRGPRLGQPQPGLRPGRVRAAPGTGDDPGSGRRRPRRGTAPPPCAPTCNSPGTWPGRSRPSSARRSTRARAPAPRARHPTEDYLLAAEISRYAGRDALAALALWNHLERHWPAHERRLFDLTSEMGRHGLAVDWDYVRAKRHRTRGPGRTPWPTPCPGSPPRRSSSSPRPATGSACRPRRPRRTPTPASCAGSRSTSTRTRRPGCGTCSGSDPPTARRGSSRRWSHAGCPRAGWPMN